MLVGRPTAATLAAARAAPQASIGSRTRGKATSIPAIAASATCGSMLANIAQAAAAVQRSPRTSNAAPASAANTNGTGWPTYHVTVAAIGAKARFNTML